MLLADGIYQVTERARHLRAHYALQCADLRARIERRINRIPVSLRSANMGDLHAKYTTAIPHTKLPSPVRMAQRPVEVPARKMPTVHQERTLPPLPAIRSPQASSPERVRVQNTGTIRNRKRKTEDIIIAQDKENEPASEHLSVAKNVKRLKAEPSNSQAHPSNVLSPRSHNSRTMRRSPIKEKELGVTTSTSPTKSSYIARPVSPQKPASPFKSAATAASSAISASIHGMVEQAKRGTATTAGKLSRTASREKTTMAINSTTTLATMSPNKSKMPPPPRPILTAQDRSVSQSSNSSAVSGSSSSTTVVKKAASRIGTALRGGAQAKKAAATAMTTATTVTKTASTMKKTTAAAGAAAGRKVVIAEPAAGRRVLRKRN